GVSVSLRSIWVMVCRTAFRELRYSWVRLAGTVLGITLMFLLPPLWLAGGGGAVLAGMLGWPGLSLSGAVALTVEGLCAWGIMAAVYRPAGRLFCLPGGRCLALALGRGLCGARGGRSAVGAVSGERRRG